MMSHLDLVQTCRGVLLISSLAFEFAVGLAPVNKNEITASMNTVVCSVSWILP